LKPAAQDVGESMVLFSTNSIFVILRTAIQNFLNRFFPKKFLKKCVDTSMDYENF